MFCAGLRPLFVCILSQISKILFVFFLCVFRIEIPHPYPKIISIFCIDIICFLYLLQNTRNAPGRYPADARDSVDAFRQFA